MQKKKPFAFIVLFILLMNVTALKAQFYDVKIIPRPTVVGTLHAPKDTLKTRLEKGSASTAQETRSEGREKSPSATPHDTLATPALPMFSPPLDSLYMTSAYGYRPDPFTGKRKFHAGTDYRTSAENVYSMMPGRVEKIGYDKKLGNYITLRHGELEVTYAHLHTVIGEKGDAVYAGQSIGISGSTGRSTGEHLHVSMKYRKKRMDPHPIILLIRDYARSGTGDTAVLSPVPSD